MTRYASSTNQTEGDKARIGVCVACALDFTTGMVRAHDGNGVKSWGGNDYIGVGTFGGIESIEESIDVIGKPLVLTLSGVDPSLIATANDASQYQGRAATIYLVFFNIDTDVVIDTPETLGVWRMSQMVVTLGKENSIRLTGENRLRRAPSAARYTDADQQLRYPSDRFFDLIGKIPLFQGTWGAKGVANDGRSTSPTPAPNPNPRARP